MNYDIEEALQNFRLASRDLYNHSFKRLIRYNSQLDEYFSDIQDLLFKSLVTDPLELDYLKYGDIQADIFVRNTMSSTVPVMINREVNSGYWDYPINELSNDAVVNFVSFFDFDQARSMDCQYVLTHITSWQKHQEIVGKFALIEYQYAVFTLNKSV